MHPITAYKTSDGKVFLTEREAKNHDLDMAIQKTHDFIMDPMQKNEFLRIKNCLHQNQNDPLRQLVVDLKRLGGEIEAAYEARFEKPLIKVP
jgi:hypothetical protein